MYSHLQTRAQEIYGIVKTLLSDDRHVPPFDVSFALYDADDDSYEAAYEAARKAPRKVQFFRSNICFRPLHDGSARARTYIWYKANLPGDRVRRLSIQELKRWVEVTKEIGLLPETVRYTTNGYPGLPVEDGEPGIEIVLNLKAQPGTLSYFHLTVVRTAREHPLTVKLFFHCIDKRMEPLLALVLAHAFTVFSRGHSAVPTVVRPYIFGEKEEPDVSSVFYNALRLKAFLSNPEKFSLAKEYTTSPQLGKSLSSIKLGIKGCEAGGPKNLASLLHPLSRIIMSIDDVREQGRLWQELLEIDKELGKA